MMVRTLILSSKLQQQQTLSHADPLTTPYRDLWRAIAKGKRPYITAALPPIADKTFEIDIFNNPSFPVKWQRLHRATLQALTTHY